jgi:hypothetical protein
VPVYGVGEQDGLQDSATGPNCPVILSGSDRRPGRRRVGPVVAGRLDRAANAINPRRPPMRAISDGSAGPRPSTRYDVRSVTPSGWPTSRGSSGWSRRPSRPVGPRVRPPTASTGRVSARRRIPRADSRRRVPGTWSTDWA